MIFNVKDVPFSALPFIYNRAYDTMKFSAALVVSVKGTSKNLNHTMLLNSLKRSTSPAAFAAAGEEYTTKDALYHSSLITATIASKALEANLEPVAVPCPPTYTIASKDAVEVISRVRQHIEDEYDGDIDAFAKENPMFEDIVMGIKFVKGESPESEAVVEAEPAPSSPQPSSL